MPRLVRVSLPMFGFGRQNRSTTSARRREELRRTVPRPDPEFVAWVRRPEFMATVLMAIAFGIGFGILIATSREVPRAFIGQLAIEPAVNEHDFAVEDKNATMEERENARRAAPRYYVANANYLSSLKAAIDGLPVATFEKTDLSAIGQELVNRFDLTSDALRELQRYGGPKTASEQWREWSDRFIGLLWSEEPIIASQEYQVFATTLSRYVLPPQAERPANATDETGEAKATPPVAQPTPRQVDLAHELPANVGPLQDDFRRAIVRMAGEAGFPRELATVVAAAVNNDPRPTVSFDDPRTKKAADAAAASVQPVLEKHPRGELIFAEGDLLTRDAIERLETARSNARESRPLLQLLSVLLGSLGLGLALSTLVLFYSVGHEPRVGRRPQRLAGVFVLMIVPAAIAAVASAAVPIVTLASAAAATLAVAMVAALAYGQRFGLFVAAIESLLVTLTIDAEPTLCLVLFLGAGTLIAPLREIRHRAAIVRASFWSAIVLGIGFIAYGVFETRLAPGGLWHSVRDAMLAAIGAYGVGFLVLGVLPTVERVFGMTTGLTLAELRDPRHPLLRQMQERAPGTYSHSLQVANLAEACAEAIGADGLLTYAGALYHDIGKINKPEYFVENQLGTANKHERLSPAMSLLVIVGHVKDGLELAKEYGLPRSLHHFVESHHGTTLVEYFFHRARSEAERKGEDEDSVEEFDFRYPGPKPRTKEAAILMLADCSESATRALPEASIGRIESLVRGLARKRLDDGQFDECPLTFADLKVVEDTLIKNLAAIHHGRIAYPSPLTATQNLPPVARA